MSVSAILVATAAGSITKWLFKRYVGDAEPLVGDSLADIGKDAIKEVLDRRKAERDIGEVADSIVRKLSASLDKSELPAPDRERLARRLGHVLMASVSVGSIIDSDLDAAKLTDRLRQLSAGMPGTPAPPADVIFDRLLQETARYLVNTAAAFPQFQREAAAYSVRQLGTIRDTIDAVLDRLERIETQTRALGGDERSLEFEKNYRAAVLQHLDWVELFGVDLPAGYRQIPLKDAFVSLDLEPEAGRDAEPPGGDEDEPEDGVLTRPCTDVLDELRPGAGRLLIEGAAGSGKTTLLRWVAINAAPFTEAAEARRGRWVHASRPDDPGGVRLLSEPEQADLHADWRNRVPFLILLRHCRDGRLPAPDDLPGVISREIGGPPIEWVRGVLNDGRGLVLIDGVDEVPQFKRDDLLKGVRALGEAYPADNYFLVTTRPDVIPDGALKAAGFRQLDVSPMGPDDVAGFIDQWHTAYARKLSAEGKPTDLTEKAAKLKTTVRGQPALAQLATNPLMCGMICALNDYRHDYLPKSLPELCQALCDMFLHRRDEERGITDLVDPAYHRLDRRQKRAVLKQLAVHFLEEGRSSVEEPSALKVVANELRSFPGHDPEQARPVLRGLIERSGMLREAKPVERDRPAEIEFVHNTLKEYLAGEWYAAAVRVNRVLEKLDSEVWRRVALFAVGTDQERDFADQVVRRLLDRGDKPSLVFALQCRAMTTYLDTALHRELDAAAESLFPPASMTEAAALAACGDAVVPFLGKRPGMRAVESAATVRVLGTIGTEAALEVMEEYRADTRLTVANELSKYSDPLQLPGPLATLRRGEPLNYYVARRVTNLDPVSQLANVEELDLSRCDLVADLRPLARLTGLRSLNLSGCVGAVDLRPLAGLIGLRHLNLSGCAETRDLSPLAGLRGLESLNLTSCWQLTDLGWMAELTGLQALRMGWCERLTDVGPVARLTGLRELDLSGSNGLTGLGPISRLTALRRLDLMACNWKVDLSQLAPFVRIQTLHLGGQSRLTDLGPLGDLVTLRELYLPRCGGLTDLEPVSNLHELQDLNMSWCTALADIGPIARLPNLRHLHLSGCKGVTDLEPLAGLTNLGYLSVDGTGITNFGPVEGHPHLYIHGRPTPAERAQLPKT